MIDPTAFIHPKAHVDEDVTIGARTKVWQFASITRGTVLGEDCSVAPFAVLDGPHFGDRCIISMHVAMGPGFYIGNDVFIGPGVVFANDLWPRVSKDGWDADKFRNGFCTIRVWHGAAIGANAVILPGVVIGHNAVIAANSTVGGNIPDDHVHCRNGVVVPLSKFGTRRRMHEADPC